MSDVKNELILFGCGVLITIDTMDDIVESRPNILLVTGIRGIIYPLLACAMFKGVSKIDGVNKNLAYLAGTAVLFGICLNKFSYLTGKMNKNLPKISINIEN